MKTELTVIIVIGIIIGFIIGDAIWESIRLKKFKQQLKPGLKFTTTIYDYGNEFDEGYIFNITILKVGKRQVLAKFSDGSISVVHIDELMKDYKPIQ